MSRLSATVKSLLNGALGWCPLYKALVGGYRYQRMLESQSYRREQFHACGEGVRICGDVTIVCPSRMIIGDHCFIADEARINAIGGLKMGNCVALASRVMILTTDHDFRSVENIPWSATRIVKPVVIEDYAWVGMNASILPGVRIGEGAIVGMGAVVSRDVPAHAIAVGNPARVVGYRDAEEFVRLRDSGAVRPPVDRCERLHVPADVREKYPELMALVGCDLQGNDEEFPFSLAPRD